MTTFNIQDIKKHANVIASCGTQVGTVDHLDGDSQVKLTRDDDPNGQHHLIPTSWISDVNGDQVILNKNSEEVRNQWKAV